MDPKDQWDLSSLFADDAAWQRAADALEGRIGEAQSFMGQLTDARSIRAFFEQDTRLELELDDVFAYAQLRRSEDLRQPQAQQMFVRASALYARAAAATAFAVPELLALPGEKLQALVRDPILADYRYQLEVILRQKPHTLSAEQEELLAQFQETFSLSEQAADSLQDADLRFAPALDAQGQEHEVTGAGYIPLQSSPDRVLRKSAFHSFYQSYQEHINTFAAIYQGQVKISTTQARVRHYASSREMYMTRENIPVEVCDRLIEVVHEYLPQMYRYAALRKRLLGVDELHYYDLYAPLASGTPRSYSWEEAEQLVLETVSVFGPQYVQKVREGLSSRWVDVYPNRGKSGGAFSSGTYHSNPFILMNFAGALNDVSTLAHEMGHSMHTYLSTRHQPPQYAQYTLFVAEVASTVNENLLVEHLLERTTDPAERLALLNQYLENFKGTVFRQTMFAEFEQQAHAMAEQGRALDPVSLGELYGSLIREYFGPELVMDEEVKLEWARIPHFYSPFYVYKYATGYSSAVAISEAVRAQGTEAVRRYLEFLSMGGSADPLDELRHAGVDLTTPVPVRAALEKFSRVLDEAQELADVLQGRS